MPAPVRTAPPPETLECFSCGFETECKAYESRLRSDREDDADRWNWYCPLCASTLASSAHQYPTHFPDAGAMGLVCRIGNMILAELAELRADVAELLEEGAP